MTSQMDDWEEPDDGAKWAVVETPTIGGKARRKRNRKPVKRPNAKYTLRTDDEIADALWESEGLISRAAEALGIDTQTIYTRAKSSDVVSGVIAYFREVLIDNAQDRLTAAVEKGEAWAVRLVLLTLGKNRGYTERKEVSAVVASPPLIWDIYGSAEKEMLVGGVRELGPGEEREGKEADFGTEESSAGGTEGIAVQD